jgi:PAS domain S-box-containing protein
MPDESTSRVLVVDDEQGIRSLLEKWLLRLGYEVDCAESVGAGAARLAAQEYDLLLLDKNLPDGTGLDLLAEIERLGHRSEAILFTAYSDTDSAIQAVNRGVFRYIRKPLDLEALALDIQNALEVKRVRDDLHQRNAELRDAISELRDAEERFRETAELLPEIVYEMNTSKVITFLNRRGFEGLGITREQFEGGLGAEMLIAPQDRERALANLNALLRGENPGSREYEALRSDGTTFPVLGRAAPIVRENELVGLRGFLFDMTEQREAEDALRETEEQLRTSQKMEAIGRLAGGIAHDFNNLLGAIKANCQVSLMDLGSEDTQRRPLEEILAVTDRASKLARQLLAFSRRQVLQPKVLDLNKVVREMEQMISRLLGADIELVPKLDPKLLSVEADPGQLEQVILNLAVNAREAMPGGGTLLIETQNAYLDQSCVRRHDLGQAGHYVMLAITDTGSGMDEETRAKVFEPFFTTKEQGSGLGLSTVYGIVRQSGGGVWVYSTPGKGTTFKVYLPTVAAEVVASLPAAPVVVAGGSETVLLVEDELVLRAPVRRMLNRWGYRVLEARNGVEALQIWNNIAGGIDLVLTDVVMPEMGGLELSRQLHELNPDVKLIYMSGHTEEAMTQQGSLEQYLAFIQKPFSASDLMALIRRVLDGVG